MKEKHATTSFVCLLFAVYVAIKINTESDNVETSFAISSEC